MNLEIVEVVPGSCWDKSRALIILPINLGDQTPPILIRFRHEEDPIESHQATPNPLDFVIAFGLETQDSRVEAQCCVMIYSRSTSLEDLASRSEYIMQKANGTKSASNGHFHLHVVLESVMGQPFFTIRSERLSGPSDVTLDANAELGKLDIALGWWEGLRKGRRV